MRVLVIEDSAEVVESVSLCFQMRWPDVSVATAADGARGIEVLESEPFDIVILDINLPDIDGFELLKRIRSFSAVPVICLTVRGREVDKARGLEMGADDYIVKPFSPIDLLARVTAVLRRIRMPVTTGEQPFLTRGKLSLNLTTSEATVGEKKVHLTPTESRLLYILMKSAGRTLESHKILQQIWGEGCTDTDSLRTYVRRLRKKLGDDPPQMILSQRGQGYRFVAFS